MMPRIATDEVFRDIIAMASYLNGSKLPETDLSFFCDLASTVLITCCNLVKTRFERIVQMTVVFYIAGRTLFIYR